MTYVELPHEKLYGLPFYLAMEEHIARVMPAQDYFFMWQVAPTVIFGRNQLLDTEVDTEFCKRNGIEFYRRKSGGGCVYADNGNIMLSYITPDTNVNFTFNRYMLMVEHALCKLGIEAKSTGRNDILIGGRKVSGNAFYHLPERSIVHGTMLYDTNLEYMTGATTPSQAKLKSKGVESVRQHVTTLKEHISLGIDEFKKYLRDALCGDTLVLTADDVAAIEGLAEFYTSPDFIQGCNPASAFSRSARIEGVGEVAVYIEVKEGMIRKMNLSGDFFIVGDIDAMLAGKLRGVPFERSAVEAAIAAVDCRNVILNLRNEELINLIFD
ncbi:MAG: lipoyltransferase [Bacteroidaceae bacterium]|nr:lipoyltransferase [Bacteroidaceae bacterium]